MASDLRCFFGLRSQGCLLNGKGKLVGWLKNFFGKLRAIPGVIAEDESIWMWTLGQIANYRI